MSDETALRREAAINEFLDAFRAVNPGKSPPKIWDKQTGWLGMQYPGSAYQSAVRERDLIAMTERMRVRLAPSLIGELECRK